MIMKAQTCFYTLFKNIPYDDEEWERTNRRRKEYKEMIEDRAKTYAYCKKFLDNHPHYFSELKTRPNRPFLWGPSFRSEEEAKKECERMLAKGAQYVSYMFDNHHGKEEQWVRSKSKPWKKVKG
jgi:hypothetical protein